MDKAGGNHEKHEKHENPWFGHILNHEWTLMDTNGEKPGGNHENHEIHEIPWFGHILNH